MYSPDIFNNFLNKSDAPHFVTWCKHAAQMHPFLQEHARVSSFSQPEKAITREQNVIDFGGYFIYGGPFMNCHASGRHAHKAV